MSPTLALATFAVLLVTSGCGRTPPTRVQTPPAKTADGEPDLLVSVEGQAAARLPPGSARPIRRDDAVALASLEVEMPAPKTEQQLAADALSRIGPPAVPMLIEALRGDNDEARRQACAVLMRMGPDAKEAVPDLVQLLNYPDEDLRRMAAVALGRIGPDAGPAVPSLMRTMLERPSRPTN